ncbi:MAG: IclR family transcriptional regulator [Frankiales bacterium]|nr:IclR family transcriptional regulator [Frankiales bacterium]
MTEAPVSMVERMTLVMDAFDASTPRLTLAELTERTGLPRSTTHRILEQLVELRWLEHSGQSYGLGMRTLEVGGLAVAHHELRIITSPLLAELHERTGAVASLAVLDKRDVVFVERHGGGLSTDPVTRVGARVPAHATAAGKAMLAWHDDTQLRASWPHRLNARTPRTLTTLDLLRQDLALTRSRNGVAYDREELAQGTVSLAVAVRGIGRATAALQLSGQVRTVSLERLSPYVLDAARKASRALFPEPGQRRRSRTVDRTPRPSPWPEGALERLVQGIGGDYWL